MNLSTQSVELERFHRDSSLLKDFLQKHRLDGIELIQYDTWETSMIPAELVKGLHMSFWPSWLDFWRSDITELEKQFEGTWTYRDYYGSDSPVALVEYYRKEIDTALRIGVRYVVFHVSHVRHQDCYTYDFTYSDREVVEAFVDLLNEVLEGVRADFQLLFENLWWPGFTLLDRGIAQLLLEKVKYPKKGFMLDAGHLMNTNLDLQNEDQAVKYIIKVLDDLGELSSHIQGIHLNSSLSGDYVKSTIQSHRSNRTVWKNDFDGFTELCRHAVKIDRHQPFVNTGICKVVQRVNPRYLVYELLTDSLEQLEKNIVLQNNILSL